MVDAMKAFDTLPLPSIIRHAISGAVTIILFLLFPITIMKPDILGDILNFGGVLGFSALSIVIGFLWDAMKLYRFSFKYSQIKSRFVKEIAIALSVPEHESLAYLAKASQLERQHHGGDIFLLHSKWIMTKICALLFVVAGVLWSSVATYQCARNVDDHSVSLYLSSFIFLTIGIRLYAMAAQEQRRIDRAWIVFCRDNAEAIKGDHSKLILSSSHLYDKDCQGQIELKQDQ